MTNIKYSVNTSSDMIREEVELECTEEDSLQDTSSEDESMCSMRIAVNNIETEKSQSNRLVTEASYTVKKKRS